MPISQQIASAGQLAANTAPLAEGSEYRPPEEDLVTGRLAQFDDFSNPVFKRAGSLASRVSASRGLSNSSIAVGAAQGAVLDRAVDVSIADSGSLVNSGMNSAQNKTSASIANASNATSLQQQIISDRNASERLGAQLESAEREGAANRTSSETINLTGIESREGMASAQRALDEKLTGLNISSAEKQQLKDIGSREGMAAAQRALDTLLTRESNASQELQNLSRIESNEGLAAAQRGLDTLLTQMGIDANTATQLKEIASKEGIASAEREMQRLGIDTDATLRREGMDSEERISKANLEAADTRARLERENQRFIQSMGIEAENQMLELKNKYTVEAMNRESVGMAWNNLQQGIANIDPNATRESQTTQFNRLMGSFDSRMGFLGITRSQTNGSVQNPNIPGIQIGRNDSGGTWGGSIGNRLASMVNHINMTVPPNTSTTDYNR